MIEKNKNWMFISIGALILSLLSLLLPIVSYTAGDGKDKGVCYHFNIFQLLDGETFVDGVLREYRGSYILEMSAATANMLILILCAIGMAAIVLSFVGLRSMSKQYESSWPFALTMAGIILTAIPAIVILIVVLMSGDQFPGEMQPGTYMYITPIAMVISCITVTMRHKLTREELRIQNAARAYIRPAGDLSLQ